MGIVHTVDDLVDLSRSKVSEELRRYRDEYRTGSDDTASVERDMVASVGNLVNRAVPVIFHAEILAYRDPELDKLRGRGWE